VENAQKTTQNVSNIHISGSEILFNDQYIICPDQPLPEYNSSTCLGFKARHVEDEEENNLYALVFHPKTPPRLDLLDIFKNFHDPNLEMLLDWGVVEWTQPASRRIAIIFKKMATDPLFKKKNLEIEPYTEEELINEVVQPFFHLLDSFFLRGVTHRHIKPTNLFLSKTIKRQIVLGQCISMPPGFDQPILFETISSSLANPVARGNGTIANDLYALGVLLSVLIIGKNPLFDLSDEAILESKIIYGSFATIVGTFKLPLGLIELLRGLLIDEHRDRWDLNDLRMWLDGRRLTPKQGILPKKALRSFVFEKKNYNQIDHLVKDAMVMGSQGLDVLKSNKLHDWLKRSLNGDLLAIEIENLYASLSNIGGISNPEKILSRLVFLITPQFPITYKKLSVKIDGIATAFVYTMDHSETKQILAEIISLRLPVNWLGCQKNLSSNQTKLLTTFEKLPISINSSHFGQGYERCLYELNPFLPCMSPLIYDLAVLNIEDLLSSLERIAPKESQNSVPFDKHIIAFIALRSRGGGDSMVAEFRMNHDRNNASFGILKLYVAILKKMKGGLFPNLAKWIANFSSLGLVDYKNLNRQNEIMSKLNEAIKKGDLITMYDIADDHFLIEKDKNEFENAKKTYATIQKFIQMIEDEKQNLDKIVKFLGGKIASLICLFVSLIGTFILLLVLI
jgi:eukaryotic-like serine/threonine-protein kinase